MEKKTEALLTLDGFAERMKPYWEAQHRAALADLERWAKMDALSAGFETVEEYRAHNRHWRSPWGRFKRLIGRGPAPRQSLLKWEKNTIRVRRAEGEDKPVMLSVSAEAG